LIHPPTHCEGVVAPGNDLIRVVTERRVNFREEEEEE
jgi:hypothetical protein